MSDDSDDEYVDYNSGPFCRHWGDPSDCDETCARCGHKCTEHGAEDGEFACGVDDCPCAKWIDSE